MASTKSLLVCCLVVLTAARLIDAETDSQPVDNLPSSSRQDAFNERNAITELRTLAQQDSANELNSVATLDAGAPPAETKQSESAEFVPEDPHLMNDLATIRRKMGGGVLTGSMLGDGKTDTTFDNQLRGLLGYRIPEPTTDAADASAGSTLVATLRCEVRKLEGIAHQLEHLRQYEHADALRESAQSLRQLARRFDTPAANSMSIPSPLPVPQQLPSVDLPTTSLPTTELPTTELPDVRSSGRLINVQPSAPPTLPSSQPVLP